MLAIVKSLRARREITLVSEGEMKWSGARTQRPLTCEAYPLRYVERGSGPRTKGLTLSADRVEDYFGTGPRGVSPLE